MIQPGSLSLSFGGGGIETQIGTTVAQSTRSLWIQGITKTAGTTGAILDIYPVRSGGTWDIAMTLYVLESNAYTISYYYV